MKKNPSRTCGYSNRNTEFYSGKREGDCRCGLFQVEWRSMKEKKKKNVILGWFYCSLYSFTGGWELK
jgi:hypothetical protein